MPAVCKFKTKSIAANYSTTVNDDSASNDGIFPDSDVRVDFAIRTEFGRGATSVRRL